MPQQTNPLNEPNKKYVQGHNRFPAMSYRHFTTGAYAQVNPFFVMETVEGDNIPLRSQHQVRTHTLKAPLLSAIHLKKDYFHVPMRAILPRTFEQIYVNPTQGTDVPDNANTVVHISDLLYNLVFLFGSGNGHNGSSNRSTQINEQLFEVYMKQVLFAETIFSDGSLLARMGYRYGPLFKYYPDAGTTGFDPSIRDERVQSFDNFFDDCIVPLIYKLAPVIEINNKTYCAESDDTIYPRPLKADYTVSLSRLLELMRSNPDFRVMTCEDNLTVGDIAPAGSTDVNTALSSVTAPTNYLNYARLIAYQLACAEFYTDAHVDVCYSAELYRDFQNSTYIELASALSTAGQGSTLGQHINETYLYNGRRILYDTLSGKNLTNVLDAYNTGTLWTSFAAMSGASDYDRNAASLMLAYLLNIFGLQRALRYGDYFTGARPSPIAVGNVNVQVQSATVSAIDMNRGIMMQRFLNFVNRTSRKFRDYIKALTGKSPDEPVDKPEYLGHTESLISGFEVENTADDQGNIVTLMKSRGGDYAFDISINEPGILLGVFYFEAQRVYANTLDRFAFKKDRYDMFNEFFQYDVDQSIYRAEKNANFIRTAPDGNFAYTGRYMEYKQRVPICTGGFKSFLRNYLFITDASESGVSDSTQDMISEEYIRSSSAELDRFYASLTNHSLAGYFHFYLCFDNVTEPSRRMDFNPTSL